MTEPVKDLALEARYEAVARAERALATAETTVAAAQRSRRDAYDVYDAAQSDLHQLLGTRLEDARGRVARQDGVAMANTTAPVEEARP